MAAGQGLMAGKKGLIMGVANNRSIAWGIAKACADQGAEIALTYQGEAFKKRVEPLAQELGAHVVGHCDVTEEETLDAVFANVEKQFGKLDFLVHAIAFSDKEELDGRYVDTTRQNFLRTMDISVYSFTNVARRAEALMTDGGSLLTLTYYGAEKVMPHYNVMGVAKAALEASVRYLAVDLGAKNIRVNAISAGPIKTLAASGIGDFRYILQMERIQRAAQAHGHAGGSRRFRPLPPLRPVARRHRRGAPRRFRLSCRRHEGRRRARHLASSRSEAAGLFEHLGASICFRWSISCATARPTGTPSTACRARPRSTSTPMDRPQADRNGSDWPN